MHYRDLFISIVISLCNKDDGKPPNPINQLSAATQTGEGTFACLFNGKLFIDNSQRFNCFYQFIDVEYYFNISGISDDSLPSDISIGAYKNQIFKNETYQFTSQLMKVYLHY